MRKNIKDRFRAIYNTIEAEQEYQREMKRRASRKRAALGVMLISLGGLLLLLLIFVTSLRNPNQSSISDSPIAETLSSPADVVTTSEIDMTRDEDVDTTKDETPPSSSAISEEEYDADSNQRPIESTEEPEEATPDSFPGVYQSEVLIRYNQLFPDEAVTEDQVVYTYESYMPQTVVSFDDISLVICETDGDPHFSIQSLMDVTEENTNRFFIKAEKIIRAIYADATEEQITKVMNILRAGNYPYDAYASDIIRGTDISINAPNNVIVPRRMTVTYDITCFKKWR